MLASFSVRLQSGEHGGSSGLDPTRTTSPAFLACHSELLDCCDRPIRRDRVIDSDSEQLKGGLFGCPVWFPVMNALIILPWCDYISPASYFLKLTECNAFLTLFCSNLPQLPAEITVKTFRPVKLNNLCLSVELLRIQVKWLVGYSEITVNYLCASCLTRSSFQYCRGSTSE